MTLQLELGKKYLNHRGEVVEIVYDRGDTYTHRWESQYRDSYTDSGAYFNGMLDPRDLVSECRKASTNPVTTTAKVPHIHADMIIAWAQGEAIEYLDEEDGEFYQTDQPSWDADVVYRIKPEKKVDVVSAWVSRDTAHLHVAHPNLRLTFEDGKLIKAEVL